MKLALLKKIRVAAALVFFLSTAVVFLDFSGLVKPAFIKSVTYLQFIPSAVKFIPGAGLAAAGFIFIIILTLFFGRVYCSTICPMGILQDIISYFNRKLRKKHFYHYVKEQVWTRYILLVVSLILALSGYIILLNLLDPFSNSGKIFTNIFRPILINGNNFAAYAFESAGLYVLYPYEIKNINVLNLVYPLIFFASVFILVYRNGRLFCNIICPVGTLLGLISKFSLFKISIDESNCRSCRLCERVCKGGCINKTEKQVDFSRCVGCYNCLTVCPSNGIIYKVDKKIKITEGPVDEKRRSYALKTIAAVFSAAGVNLGQYKISPKKKSTVAVNRKHPSTPPGSISIEHFSDRCTACHLCVSACPTQVLQPSFTEYGLTGLFQPVMDYRSGFCNYDCQVCTEVCPSGALQALTIEKKRLVQLGKAKFIKENCIVYTENTACGACSEHCPTKAVNMVPYKNINIPQVYEEYCTGCGACEHACPTQPYKSIYVEGNPVHLSAKLRPAEKLQEKTEEDFPF